MSEPFYGWEQADQPANHVDYPGIHNPRDMYRALCSAWCRETCAPRMQARWSEENPTLGQCSVTAFLAQDIFGGDVYGIPRPNGGVHCFNVVAGKAFDLTSEQFFGETLDYAHAVLQTRETHFSKEEKKQRYELLRARLRQVVQGKAE